jgi:predicted O-methyltransferase YrrM
MTSRDATPLLPLAVDSAFTVQRTAADWAWLLGFGAISWPWLLRSLSGGSAVARSKLIRRLDLAPDALPHLGSWKADAGFLRLIESHIRRLRPQTVVEFGAGASSLVAAQALARNGSGVLLSFDQHRDFADQTQAWLASHGLHAHVRNAPLVEARGTWSGQWYDHGQLPERIDLLIVDGPPWTVHPLTRGSAESLFDRIPPGGAVLLDDAARPGERIVAAIWRKRWPDFNFRFVRSGSKGTLIGTRRKTPA